MYVRRSPERVLVFLAAGPRQVAVAEDPSLLPEHVEFTQGVLFVGKGTDVDEAVFRLNCTAADVRFLQSIHIEAP